MKRRELIAGGLAAGALCALPARAGEQGLAGSFGLTVVPPTSPVDPPVITVPLVNSAAYIRRLGEIARRERDRAGAKLWRKDVIGIADYALPSSRPRLHFINMESGAVHSFLVAHGKGSDPQHDGWLKHFSRDYGSEQTSRGSYLTCEWYNGKYGTSIRLAGLDSDNSTALDRAIVMHPAAYVEPSMIEKFGKIGRSLGCFAMAPGDFNEALWHLSGGRLLFADRIGEG